MSEPLSPTRRLFFALGSPGYQITDRIVVLMAVYFYLPPPGRGLEARVPEHAFLGFLTVYGLATLFGRIFDTVADPVVGHMSDRSRSRLGRRRSLLIFGVAPMVAIPVLLFFPPWPGASPWNGAWVGGLLALYFVAFTAYVAPYLALIPEVAWDQRERVRLTQWMSFSSLPILGVLTAWGVGLDLGRAAGLSPDVSFRTIVVGLSLLSLLLCLGPIVAVDETRHTRGDRSEFPFRQALLATLRNRPFLLYLLANAFFIVAINLIQPALPYLATVVLGRSEGFTLWLTLATAAGVAVGFAFQRPTIARFGPKRVMMGCVAVMALALAPLGLLTPALPGAPGDLHNLALCFAAIGLFGVPAAGFLVLPHILIGQLIDRDARRTGASRAAMFYGVQGLATKWVFGLATWLLTFLLARYGNSPDEPSGVLLIGPVAAAFAAASALLFALYPERQVLDPPKPPDPGPAE
jgi:GPH family glycoside/pentoside/hexuronide:cation symporter